MAIPKITSKAVNKVYDTAQQFIKKDIERYPYISASTYLKPIVKEAETIHPFFSSSTPIGEITQAPEIGQKIDFFAF